MTEIKIPEGELSSVLGHAILQSLSEDTKETMIRGALEYLLEKPPSTGYGARQASPLQEAFNNAIHRITNEMVYELVKEHPRSQEVRDQIDKLFDTWPDMTSFEMQGKLASAVIERAEEIKRDRY